MPPRLRPCQLRAGVAPKPRRRLTARWRGFLTLAIESSWWVKAKRASIQRLTSCHSDDSSVALLETNIQLGQACASAEQAIPKARLLFHEKATAANTQWRGVHPLYSLHAHERNLPGLVQSAVNFLEETRQQPDLVAVTRGPGMLSSLRVGLNLAKGLALAWKTQFIGVHHMQAHALTPRLEEALSATVDQRTGLTPSFPFLSVLVSGGHTLLLRSDSIVQHSELAKTADIAIGVCLDRVARNILPKSTLDSIPDSGYARLLEPFVFPDGLNLCAYRAPRSRQDELRDRTTSWGWKIPLPLIDSRTMQFSFSGVDSAVKRVVEERGGCMSDHEKRDLAQKAMEAAFESLGSRLILALDAQSKDSSQTPQTVVLSGGVASNQFLRLILRRILDARGYQDIALMYPRPSLCTDNAAMIAWAGVEMCLAGWRTSMSCTPIAKWDLAPQESKDGSMMETEGWIRLE